MKKFVFVLICTCCSLWLVANPIEDLEDLRRMDASAAIQKARDTRLFDNLNLDIVSAYGSTIQDRPFTKPAAVRFTANVNGQSVPVANQPVIITYPVQTETHQTIMQKKTVYTDEDGAVSFSLEPFNYPILSAVTFTLQLFNQTGFETDGAAMQLASDTVITAGKKDTGYTAESQLLQPNEAEKIIAVFDVKVAGKKTSGLKFSIDITDFSIDGVRYGKRRVGTSLLGECMKRRMLWPGNFESAALFKANANIDDALPEARAAFAGNVADYIYGQSKIIKLDHEDNNWTATCRATIKVWNMRDDRLSKEFTCEASAVAQDSGSACYEARTALGILITDIVQYGVEFH